MDATSTVAWSGTLPAAGSQSVRIPLVYPGAAVIVQVTAEGFTAPAPTGVAVSFFYSRDGTTFYASAMPGYTLAPTPVGAVQGNLIHYNDAWKTDEGGVVAYQITLQNLDQVNGCAVTVLTQQQS